MAYMAPQISLTYYYYDYMQSNVTLSQTLTGIGLGVTGIGVHVYRVIYRGLIGYGVYALGYRSLR